MKLFTLALALCFLASPARAGAPAALLPSITVQGTGEVAATPDTAEIQAGVVTQAEFAAEALDANSAAMTKVMQTLEGAGLAKKDIQTSQFSVSPVYERNNEHMRERKIVGYQVTNQVQIKVRKLDSVGEILDKLVAQGANQVNSIRFSVAEPERLLDEARRKAMADARRKAELYVQAEDLKLGRPLLIQEQAPRLPQARALQAAAFAARDAVPIAAGELTFQASIQVTYRLD